MTTTHDDRDATPPTLLNALIQTLGFSGAALGRLFGLDRGAAGRWLSGEVAVPPWVIAHLELLVLLRSICSNFSGHAVPAPLNQPKSYRLSGNSDDSAENMPNILQIGVTVAGMADSKPAMTPDAFLASLNRIGWRQADFARRAGCGANAVTSWVKGATRVPAWVPVHLELLEQVQGLAQYVAPPRERKPRSGL